MLQNSKPVPPPKPPIAAKPKVTQQKNVVIVGNGRRVGGDENQTQPLIPPRAHKLPASPPNISDCANDCCGILNKQLECIQRPKKNGAHSNGSDFHAERENENHRSDFKASSQSFDSSSSSSGGFRDSEFVTKTRVAYELYEKGGNGNDHETPAYQMPISHNKVQEMKSKLFAQQQQQQQNHSNHEPSIIINRQSVQKSSRELEKVLGLRIESQPARQKAPSNQDKLVKRLSKSFDDAQDVATIGANISKQIQQKLTEEMKQQCEIIKEKFLIEKMPVQQHYGDYTVT